MLVNMAGCLLFSGRNGPSSGVFGRSRPAFPPGAIPALPTRAPPALLAGRHTDRECSNSVVTLYVGTLLTKGAKGQPTSRLVLICHLPDKRHSFS